MRCGQTIHKQITVQKVLSIAGIQLAMFGNNAAVTELA